MLKILVANGFHTTRSFPVYLSLYLSRAVTSPLNVSLVYGIIDLVAP